MANNEKTGEMHPRSRPERVVHILPEEKKPGGKNKVLIVIIVMIIMTILFWGGWFVFSITKAGSEVITKNYSGGAPILHENSLPEPEEVKASNNLVNILLLGNGGAGHSGGALCDVIQVLCINPATKKALLVSVPRDLFIDIDGHGLKKINEMYYLGEQEGKGQGGAASKKEIEKVLGMPIHYYFKVDFTGFKKIIDLVSGIDIYVEKGISDPIWGYYINPGMHHFNGSQALDYVRSRESTSDFDRSARQQAVLLSLRDKALQADFLRDPSKIGQAIEILADNVRTDITPTEMYQISNIAKDIPQASLSSYVIDNRKDDLLYSTMSKGGAYILLPIGEDFSKIQNFVKAMLP